MPGPGRVTGAATEALVDGSEREIQVGASWGRYEKAEEDEGKVWTRIPCKMEPQSMTPSMVSFMWPAASIARYCSMAVAFLGPF